MKGLGAIAIVALGVVGAVGFVAFGGDGGGGLYASLSEADAGVATYETAIVAPDTTGAGLWLHLQAEAYQDNWDLWPGTTRLYEGQQPHGMKLTTYVNELVAGALRAGETTMPDGSVVVKENYMPDGTLAAITVMYKRSGYNPEHNDWFFTKHLPSGELDTMPNGMAMEGRLPGCQGCHLAVASRDYLYNERPSTE